MGVCYVQSSNVPSYKREAHHFLYSRMMCVSKLEGDVVAKFEDVRCGRCGEGCPRSILTLSPAKALFHLAAKNDEAGFS